LNVTGRWVRGKNPRHSHGYRWPAGYGRPAGHPGTTLVAGLRSGFGLLPP